MTHVITCACLKGGSGKTTVSQAIASVLVARGFRTLLVDLDPQRTSLRWSGKATDGERPDVIAVDGDVVRREVPRVSVGYDFAILDCPPQHSKATRGAILVADLVLVPISPGQGDLWGLEETASMIDELRAGRDFVALAVLNRAAPRTLLTREMRDGARALPLALPLLAAELCDRVAFPEALAAGEGVVTYDRAGRAAAEAVALTDAALAAMGAAA
jgi:chromosome partitioning protein